MPPTIQLRDVVDADMPIFFAQQKEPAEVQMAAFTAKDPNDRVAFDSQWASIRADRGITLQTILYEEAVAGTILCHSWFGAPEISYWLGEAFWGKGIATAALQQFLKQVTIRPLLARVAHDNVGSLRVLQKCNFVIIAQEKGFAQARGQKIPEYILTLNDA